MKELIREYYHLFLNSLYNVVFNNFWIDLLKKYELYSKKRFTFLDIGCGNHSALRIKGIFPTIRYFGIDRMNYNNNEQDFRLMEKYYEINLDKNYQLDEIPNDFFDFVNLRHVIEHLHYGDRLLEKVFKKIKSKGFIYIEFPSSRSIHFPHLPGTLNFYDDKTHVRLYALDPLIQKLESNNFIIRSSGTIRRVKYLLYFPILVLLDLYRFKKVTGPPFWDILGFSEYIFAQKI